MLSDKRLAAFAAAIVSAATLTPSLTADDSVKIEHLGTNNTLVRVTGDGDILLMPVQESIDDAKVNVLVDGKNERTMFVRLAKS